MTRQFRWLAAAVLVLGFAASSGTAVAEGTAGAVHLIPAVRLGGGVADIGFALADLLVDLVASSTTEPAPPPAPVSYESEAQMRERVTAILASERADAAQPAAVVIPPRQVVTPEQSSAWRQAHPGVGDALTPDVR
jgi:hypothetical protein